MFYSPKTTSQMYPTNIVQMGSSIQIAIRNDYLLSIYVKNQDAIAEIGVKVDESLTLLNWVLRRIFHDAGLYVADYVEDTLYEEVYDSYFAEERFSLLLQVNGMLKQRDYTPVLMQGFCTSDTIILSFGAPNVDRIQQPKRS